MKNIIAIIVIALFVFTNVNVFADNDKNIMLTVQGQVIDKNTGEPLAGVTINVDGQEVYTDFDGNFTVSVPSTSTISASFISYETVEVSVEELKATNGLQIELEN